MKRIPPLPVLIVSLLFALPVTAAENAYEVSFGDYTVNYNAFPSEMLEPSVAKAVNISRASYRGVVTIAVRKKNEGGDENPTAAEVSGNVTNLIGQRSKLEFSKVKEEGSLYYISDFSIPQSGNKLLNFSISVRPDGEKARQKIEFKRQY